MVACTVPQLDEILDRLLADSAGAFVVALAGVDGLVVEQRPDGASDLALCVAELSGAVTSLRRAIGDGLDGGAVEALQVDAAHARLLVQHATAQHYLLVGLPSAQAPGAARAALSEAARAVRELVV